MPTNIEIAQPFYPDLAGLPLNGSIYYGVAGQNPVTNPITVYWDLAATQPAAQPIPVVNGLTVHNGAPARVYVTGDYSKLVQDSHGRQVMFESSQSTVGDVVTLVADSTGATCANTALANANAVAQEIVIPKGTYRICADLTLTADLIMQRGGMFTIDSGVTLTINGPFKAGMSQVFTGAGSVKFGAGTIDYIRPEWFGCVMAGPAGPFVDNSAAFLKCIQCATSSTTSFTYKIKLSQGVLALGSATGDYCVVVPTTGVFHLEGEGRAVSQIRAIAVGGVWPRGLLQFTGSTADNRLEDIFFYGGSSSSPTKYGVDSSQMTHMDTSRCTFANFSIAGYVIAQWSNSIKDCDLTRCGVGVWLKATNAGNDNTIDTCRFVDCTVPVVVNAGVNTRILNCQFQAPNTAPFSRCHVYANGNTIALDANYFESQSFGGMAGMTFTVPETVTIWADIICNGEPYYTDEEGTVTTTLSQTAPGSGTVLTVNGSNNFNTAAYYIAGAGGSGYTAGTATILPINGQGDGTATCTIGVTSGSVNSTSGFVGGSGYLPGDRVRLIKDGSGAVGIVTATGANNAPTAIRIGGEATIYAGNCRSLVMENNQHGGGAYLSVYKDPTYCDFQRVTLINPLRASNGGPGYSISGAYTAVLRSKFADIEQNNLGFISGTNRRNYFGSTLNLPAVLAKSTFSRNSGRTRGLPYYRLTLNAAETASDVMSGSITVGTSGPNNPELCGRRLYFAVTKSESGANIKLRLTLSAVNGTSTVTIGNFDNSTAFTSSPSASREEVSIVVPTTGGTINWTLQVIAASAAAGQYVDIMAPVITMVGFPYDSFPVADFNAEITGTATLDAASLADGAGTTMTIPAYGARVGDATRVAAPYTLQGITVTSYVAASNSVEVRIQNESGGAIDLASGTWTAYVLPA